MNHHRLYLTIQRLEGKNDFVFYWSFKKDLFFPPQFLEVQDQKSEWWVGTKRHFDRKTIKVWKNKKRFSYIVMGRASKFWARAWGLTHPYRWVEPAKPKLEPPFQVSSLSRARAEPHARSITMYYLDSVGWSQWTKNPPDQIFFPRQIVPLTSFYLFRNIMQNFFQKLYSYFY